MDDDEFRYRENYKQRIRQEDRDDADSKRQADREAKSKDKADQDLIRREMDAERQQLRASINAGEFNRRNNIKRSEKEQDLQRKNEGEIYKSDIQRFNHADSLEHSTQLSKQEHGQRLKEDAQWRQHEITVLNGKLHAEQLFIQERHKGELALTEAEHKRAEMLAKYEYDQALGVQQEITNRDMSVAQEQTKRETEIVQLNNIQALALDQQQHLELLEQKARDLSDYEARTRADTEALRIKEDDGLERRLTESKHNHRQDIQKLHAEFLRMKLENNLKKDYFTHEQETLLRMRKLARDLGLDPADLSASDISEMIMDFENLERGNG